MQQAVRLVLPRRSWRRGDVVRLAVAATAAALTVAGAVTGAGLRLAEAESPRVPMAQRPGSEAAAPAPVPPLRESEPVSLSIPAIGLSTNRVVELGQAPTGAMEVPADAGTVGWFGTSAGPATAGASIMSGHTQLGYERGVFYGLRVLNSGDTITVGRGDDSAAVFTVYRLERVTGIAAAVELARTSTSRPELRLLTWAGDSVPDGARDRSLVVFARMSSARS